MTDLGRALLIIALVVSAYAVLAALHGARGGQARMGHLVAPRGLFAGRLC